MYRLRFAIPDSNGYHAGGCRQMVWSHGTTIRTPFVAENRLAETEFQLATQFRSSQVSDHFGTLGFPNARYTVTSSDDPR